MLSDFLKLVGENVRKTRKERGMTQEELAEKVGLQNTYIGGIERGERNISLETLEKVANGLEVKPNTLLDFKDLEPEKFRFLSKDNLLEIHRSLLYSRSEDEITLIHKTVKDILLILDSKR